ALITPFYLLVQTLHLLGTKTALIVVHSVLTLPFTVLILTIFFRRIPRAIEEAALLDGCTRLQIFLRIMLPLARTSVFATGVFAFILSYAEFLFALVLSGDAANRPLSVVMAALARNTDVSWGLLNASVFLAVIPTVALIGIVWRFGVEELLAMTARGCRGFRYVIGQSANSVRKVRSSSTQMRRIVPPFSGEASVGSPSVPVA